MSSLNQGYINRYNRINFGHMRLLIKKILGMCMKMILVHNWIIRQTSLHALLVSCFPLHNITYDYIFQAGLMNNVLLRYKAKDWDLHSTVSDEFRRSLNLCTFIQFYKLIGLCRMS